jgi:hypothetical protein
VFELTHEQSQELANPEPRAIDPQTKQTYVLVREDMFEKIKNLICDDEEWSEETLRSQLSRSSQANGWNEPEMDDYDRYDDARDELCR